MSDQRQAPATLGPLVAIQALLLALAVVASVLFFARSRLTPRFLIGQRVAAHAATFTTLYLRPPASALAVSAAWVGSVIALALTAAIIGYLLKSRRVRNTFVR